MVAVLSLAFALSPTQVSRIDGVVRTVMREHAIAGLSLAVARRGERLYVRGYGERDSEHHLRADGFTIYAAGSLAKQFTAALALRAVEAGRLALDGGMPPLRDLLSHTVGGTWRYDNANYERVGELLERATGTPYCALLAREIAVPLRLMSTSCGAPALSSNVATRRGLRQDDALPPAAAGLWSNAIDLVRWLEDLRSGRVVSKTDFNAMTSSRILPNGTPANYGYGFFIDDWYGYRVAHHSGLVDGYSAEDAIVLDDGLELAIAANADRVDLVPLAKSLVTVVDPPRDRNLYAAPSQPPQNENTAITRALAELLATSGFSQLGRLESLEFVERTMEHSITYDKYRATFTTAQRWVTVGYGSDGTIASVRIDATR